MFAFLSQRLILPSRICLCFAVVTCLLIAGCGGTYPEAKYVDNETTKSLIKEARTGKFDGKNEVDLMGMDDYMQQLFGTPAKMVAWQRLPVNYGGISGTITKATEEGTFTVKFDEVVAAFSKPRLAYAMPIKKEEQGTDFTIDSYDPITSQIAITSESESNLLAGTTFVLNPGETLKQGYHLYMQHCLHCHGTSGDGAGPTAEYLTPRPRDFRKGVFKFKATQNNKKIRREDLARTIQQGIPGTYMPSFLLLEKEELSSIIEYVRWLAIRGELEGKFSTELAAGFSKEMFDETLANEKESDKREELKKEMLQELQDKLRTEFPTTFDEATQTVSSNWRIVEEDSKYVIRPQMARPIYKRDSQEYRDSIARGKKVFLNSKNACTECHGVTGRGNGPNTENFQAIKGVTPKKFYDKPGLYDDWGNPIQPRDLTRGLYRGGRRPIDIYRRIRGAIEGTPMMAFKANAISDEQMWDLINYIMSLPFEKTK